MSLNKKTVDDINVKGKKVLVRCDFNVPLKEGKITDENRLVAALPTIKKLLADGGRVILCSHLGKPKGEPKPELSLAPVAARLSELLGQEVKFAADPEVVGPNAQSCRRGYEGRRLHPAGEHPLPRRGDQERRGILQRAGFPVRCICKRRFRYRSSCPLLQRRRDPVRGYLCGRLSDGEGDRVPRNAVENPVRPFVAILGGAKVADKLNVISNLLEKCDTLIIGGGMAFTFLKAQGKEVGKSLVDDTKLDYCKEMIEKAEKLGKKLLLPVDAAVAASFPNPIDAAIDVKNVSAGRDPGRHDGPGHRTQERRAVRRGGQDRQDRCVERPHGRI